MNLGSKHEEPVKEDHTVYASKVEITPQTRAIVNESISSKKRKKLREQAVIDLINSKPAGTKLTYPDFMQVTNLEHGSTGKFLANMVEEGKIGRIMLGPIAKNGFSYYVAVKGKKLEQPTMAPTHTAAKESAVEQVQPISEEPIKETNHINVSHISELQIASALVEKYAKDYYWETTSNDIKGFVKWMDERANAHKE
jgi:hypothetical protein